MKHRAGRPRSFDRDVALERAMQVFWRQGYEATSISDLTSALGINPPSLYAAFGDKQRLFLEAVERYAGGPGGAALRILAEEPTARGAIARVLESAAVDFTRPDRPRGCMVVTAATTCAALTPSGKADLARRREASREALRKRIERGVREGELPAGTDPRALATFYVTVLQGMSIQARDGATRRTLLATARCAMRAWPRARRRGPGSSSA
jgi:AcrR family transcriptional regulator